MNYGVIDSTDRHRIARIASAGAIVAAAHIERADLPPVAVIDLSPEQAERAVDRFPTYATNDYCEQSEKRFIQSREKYGSPRPWRKSGN